LAWPYALVKNFTNLHPKEASTFEPQDQTRQQTYPHNPIGGLIRPLHGLGGTKTLPPLFGRPYEAFDGDLWKRGFRG